MEQVTRPYDCYLTNLRVVKLRDDSDETTWAVDVRSKLPNGEMGADVQRFNLAIPGKVPQEVLISRFKEHGIELPGPGQVTNGRCLIANGYLRGLVNGLDLFVTVPFDDVLSNSTAEKTR